MRNSLMQAPARRGKIEVSFDELREAYRSGQSVPCLRGAVLGVWLDEKREVATYLLEHPGMDVVRKGEAPPLYGWNVAHGYFVRLG